jgi:hypothetical protein
MQKWGRGSCTVDFCIDLVLLTFSRHTQRTFLAALLATRAARAGFLDTLYVQDSQKPMVPPVSILSNETTRLHGLTHGLTLMLPSAYERPMFYVAVYALLGIPTVIGDSLGTAILILGAYRASKVLFKRLLYSVTRATMRVPWYSSDWYVFFSFSFTRPIYSLLVYSVLFCFPSFSL